MYIIGLIDDEESELRSIRRTIKSNAPPGVSYGFKSYVLQDNAKDLVAHVFQEVLEDIRNGKVSLLVIDYKIMVQMHKVEGTEIFKCLQDEVPKFPMVFLTNVVEDCIDHSFVDPDKVYRKSEFFQIEEAYSKEKTENIFRNMERYCQMRTELELRLGKLKEDLVKNGTQAPVLKKILATETQLDELTPLQQSRLEKAFDPSKIKEVVQLLKEADELLEE